MSDAPSFPGTGGERDCPALTTDERLDLLASGERRCLLRYLHEQSDPVPVAELAAHLSANGHDHPRVRLEHAHLPKLDDTGVVAYDSGRERVDYRSDERLERLLDAVDRVE